MSENLKEIKEKLFKKTEEILVSYGVDPFLKDHHYEHYDGNHLVEKLADELILLTDEEIINFFKELNSKKWNGEHAPYECLMNWIFCQLDGTLSETNITLFEKIRDKFKIHY